MREEWECVCLIPTLFPSIKRVIKLISEGIYFILRAIHKKVMHVIIKNQELEWAQPQKVIILKHYRGVEMSIM